MKAENIFILLPMRSTWNKLEGFRTKYLISEITTASFVKRNTIKLSNIIVNKFVEVAYVVATVFAFLYCCIAYPFRAYQWKADRKAGITTDLSRLKTPRLSLHLEIQLQAYFYKHWDHFKTLSSGERRELVQTVMSQAARSKDVFSPIARQFVDHLLEEANKEGKKLVFMARDGAPFYEIAKKMMEDPKNQAKYSNLPKDDPIVYGYFSRNLVNHATSTDEDRTIFKDYMEKNLHIKPGDKCIFVDIGFAGSMVAPIKSALPENEVEFEFLIATSNKAKGFIANSELPLENFESEKHHLGTRWLEETHHGTLASAKRLIRNDKGEIEVVFDSSGFRSEKHPLKVRIDPKFSLPYLIRKFCLKSVVESAAALPPQSKEVKENARKKLGDLMGQLLNGELPMLLGWDK